MAKAREIKRRMRSVESTRKITRTMEMVAASKLRRAQERVWKARPYAEALVDVIEGLIRPELTEHEPILRQPDEIRRAAVVLLTSNRGLCGAFNTNLIRYARDLLDRLHADNVQTEFHVVGRKGISYFRFRGVELAGARTDIGDRPSIGEARTLLQPLVDRFAAGELDAVYLVTTEFQSIATAPPVTRRLLPVTVPEKGVAGGPWFILEPSSERILSGLLPLYVTSQAFRSLVETTAGFYAAQRTAMKNATDNAEELLTRLRRRYNRARQAEITQQIAEIMGGAEALAE
jgi:F-type H+-transporting ATPase subunit gamma